MQFNQLVKNLFLFVIIASFVMFPFLAQAQEGIVPCGLGEKDPCTLCHLIVGIQRLVDFGLKLLATIAIVGIFFAGIMYIVSSGSDTMMKQAKSFLTASITGFAIVLMAWFIVNVTIWLITKSGQIEGLQGKTWNSFSCDETSSALSGTAGTQGGTTPTAQETNCCVKTNNASDPNYGKSENCTAPTGGGPSKAECEKWCENSGGSEDYIKECKSGCKDPEPMKCEEGNMVQGACSTMPACGGTTGVGKGEIVAAAKKYDSQNCQYSQPLRNSCAGNPAYTDCSNFVDTCYKAAGCTSPGNQSSVIGAKGEAIGDRSTLQAGDVLWKEGHVAICVSTGCGTVIHASGEKDDIKESGGSYPNSFSKVIRASRFCN